MLAKILEKFKRQTKETLIIYILTVVTSVIITAMELFHLRYSWTIKLGRVFSSILVALIFSFIVAQFIELLYFKRLKNLFIKIFSWLLLLVFLLETTCIVKFNTKITLGVLQTILDTNIFEITSFYKTYMDSKVVFIFLFVIFLGWKTNKASIINLFFNLIKKFKKACFITISIVFIVATVIHGKEAIVKPQPPLGRLLFAFYNVHQGAKAMEQMVGNEVPIKLLEENSTVENVIFVIGESASSHLMGMYSSKYDSTPLCDKLIETKNLFKFNNVISPKVYTAGMIPLLLSSMNAENQKISLQGFDNLAKTIKTANYTTFWLSNQEKISTSLAYGTYTASLCDYNAYTQSLSNLAPYDEALLPILDRFEINKLDKNFFIIHLQGSHIYYKDRYPNGFSKYKPEDCIEKSFKYHQKQTFVEYLNSIYYTDFILNTIVEKFKNEDSLLIYVSDHAEELWQAGFHGRRLKNVSKYMVDIPMFIWVSDKFKALRPQKVAQIASSLERPYMNDDVFHTILDLLDIHTSQYDPTRSVINNKFIDRDRYVEGIKYENLIR